MNIIKKQLVKITVLMVCLIAVTLPAVPATAEDVLSPGCQGVSGSTLCDDRDPGASPTSNRIYGQNGIITKAVRLLSWVVGIAAVIAIIIGGFKYITASGDSNNINSAKNTILFAIIGLLVASVGQALIILVLSKL